MSETILERYQAHRIRRYLANEERYRHYLPSWRTPARRRCLVHVLSFSLLLLVAASIFTLVGPEWAPATWLPGAVLMSASWTMLQIVSGRRSDAPADALDEWELQRRNNARSIGFTITQATVTIPALALVWATSFTDDPRLALGGGFLIISGLLIGVCSPGIVLAWTMPDDEPEEIQMSPIATDTTKGMR